MESKFSLNSDAFLRAKHCSLRINIRDSSALKVYKFVTTGDIMIRIILFCDRQLMSVSFGLLSIVRSSLLKLKELGKNHLNEVITGRRFSIGKLVQSHRNSIHTLVIFE